jgi:hypothetical protein
MICYSPFGNSALVHLRFSWGGSMSDLKRGVLSYSTPAKKLCDVDPIGKLAVVAILFAVTHWATECFTSYELEIAHKIVVVYRTRNDDTLRRHVMLDLMIEAEIAFCAAIVLFGALIMARLFLRRRLVTRAALVAVIIGVAFCWIRWIIDIAMRATDAHYSESADWTVAMLLSLVLSLALIRWNADSHAAEGRA